MPEDTEGTDSAFHERSERGLRRRDVAPSFPRCWEGIAGLDATRIRLFRGEGRQMYWMLQYEWPNGEQGRVRQTVFRATDKGHAVLSAVESAVRHNHPGVKV